jgi:hypothetical protein
MKKRLLGVVIVLLSALILTACTGGANLREVADIVSPTLTAIAQQGDADSAPAGGEAAPEETEPPGPPEPPDRCDLFTPEENKFVLHTISWGDQSFVMYVKLPDGQDVPGLVEPIEGDDAAWIYEATIGGLESLGCRTYEGDIYKGRIYCVFPIDNSYYNTAQPFAMMVNGCDTPISSHPRLSLVVPEPEEEAASSVEPAVCTVPAVYECGAAYEDYCHCLGVEYECFWGWGFNWPYCYDPAP